MRQRSPLLPIFLIVLVDVLGFTIVIDGETIAVREVRMPAIKTTGDGPIDVYLALASLLAGTAMPSVQPPEAAADHLFEPGALSLAHLDAALEASPFDGTRWPLERPGWPMPRCVRSRWRRCREVRLRSQRPELRHGRFPESDL